MTRSLGVGRVLDTGNVFASATDIKLASCEARWRRRPLQFAVRTDSLRPRIKVNRYTGEGLTAGLFHSVRRFETCNVQRARATCNVQRCNVQRERATCNVQRGNVQRQRATVIA